MTLPLETGILYGPLFSRRLGLSLGVNLLPASHKVCNFDCIYCHYGLSGQSGIIQREDYPAAGSVVQAVEQALRGTQHFDTLTFSGNGEPTLHPDFGEIMTQVRQLRDRLRPEVLLSLYSNASTVGRPRVLEVLRYFDNPILKLDAGDPQFFQAVNRPTGMVKLTDIIENLRNAAQHVSHLLIQSLLVSGLVNTSTEHAVQSWQDALAEIKPSMVQLYSCDYPVPVPGVTRVLPHVLQRIARETEARTGISVEPFWIV